MTEDCCRAVSNESGKCFSPAILDSIALGTLLTFVIKAVSLIRLTLPMNPGIHDLLFIFRDARPDCGKRSG